MKKFAFYLALLTGLIVVAISLYGFIRLQERPGLPPTIDKQKVVKVDASEIQHTRDFDFVLRYYTVGDEVTVTLQIQDQTKDQKVQLVHFYSNAFYPWLYLIISLICMVIALAVLLMRRKEPKAHILYWAGLFFGGSTITSGAYYYIQDSWAVHLPALLFLVSFVLSSALLLHFSLSFSARRLSLAKVLVYILALFFVGAFITTYILCTYHSSISIYRVFLEISKIFRVFLFVAVFAAIFHFIFCYKKAAYQEEKAQILWIFFGLFFGLGPFLLLCNFPQILGIRPLLSEEFSAVFFIFIPLGFAFSIIRFKLLDIDLVINKSMVYSLLTVFTICVYLLFVRLFYALFSKLFTVRETVFSVAGMLVAAVAFYPAQRKIQVLVDKAFFRQSLDYRKSILSFNERASYMSNIGHLVDFFIAKVKKTLPMDFQGMTIYASKATDSGKQKLLIARNGGKHHKSLLSLSLRSNIVYASESAVKTRENIDFTLRDILREKGIEVLIPVPFQLTALEGVVILGKKKSGERYTADDFDLLLTMTRELAVNLERIRLQEEVIYEKAEKEKLDELSRSKTEFISTVSHELRTPMSSIQGITEMLLENKIKEKEKRTQLIHLMAEESGRLSRFIHNILDFGKIEQKVKIYHFQKTPIQPLVDETVNFFEHKLEQEGFTISTSYPKRAFSLEVDRDAVKQTLMNLIDNAIKYSTQEKDISIEIREMDKTVEICVSDKGIGISPEDQKHIFDKFFRSSSAQKYNPKGIGLGLQIASQIMAAHKGKITLTSEPNKGSIFTLIFPKK